MKQYRICGTEESCTLKNGKRCGLGADSSCLHQGAKVTTHETREQVLNQFVEECR